MTYEITLFTVGEGPHSDMWLISIKPNLHVTMKQRQGNLEEVILHMATCWVDLSHIGGTRDCIFYDL